MIRYNKYLKVNKIYLNKQKNFQMRYNNYLSKQSIQKAKNLSYKIIQNR